MHVIRHYAPGVQGVAIVIEVLQSTGNDLGDGVFAEPTTAMTGVELGFDFPVKEVALLLTESVGELVIFGLEGLVEVELEAPVLVIVFASDGHGDGAGQAEGDGIGGAVSGPVRKVAFGYMSDAGRLCGGGPCGTGFQPVSGF